MQVSLSHFKVSHWHMWTIRIWKNLAGLFEEQISLLVQDMSPSYMELLRSLLRETNHYFKKQQYALLMHIKYVH